MRFAGVLAKMSSRYLCHRVVCGIALVWGSSFLPVPISAFQPQAKAQEAAVQTSARYLISVHGLHALTANVAYRLASNAYSGVAQVQTAGLFGLFVQTDMRMQGTGQFLPNGLAEPAQYDSAGSYNRAQSHLHMVYKAGVPQITVQEPALDNREDVPPTERAGSQDVVAVLVGLLHQMQTQKQCQEVPQKLFDGLRLSTLNVRNTGFERPPAAASKEWGQEAWTCNFVLQQVRGFKANSQLSKLRQPQIGRVWFEDIPHIGMSVVRMEIEHPKMGHIVIRLDATPTQAP